MVAMVPQRHRPLDPFLLTTRRRQGQSIDESQHAPELAKSLKSGSNDVTGGSWPHQSTTFRERHVTLSIGYGYLKRENEKKPNLEERAAALPHELKTLRCPIQRGKDVIDDAMRGLTDGQQQLERIR